MNRTIPFSPEHTIDCDGVVFETQTKRTVPPFACEQANGVTYLAVMLGGERHLVWLLLNEVWYDGEFLIPRNGCFLDWRKTNVFGLVSVSGTRITDTRHIHRIWREYQAGGAACWQLADKTGYGMYSIDEYKVLIQDILAAGVR